MLPKCTMVPLEATRGPHRVECARCGQNDALLIRQAGRDFLIGFCRTGQIRRSMSAQGNLQKLFIRPGQHSQVSFLPPSSSHHRSHHLVFFTTPKTPKCCCTRISLPATRCSRTLSRCASLSGRVAHVKHLAGTDRALARRSTVSSTRSIVP